MSFHQGKVSSSFPTLLTFVETNTRAERTDHGDQSILALRQHPATQRLLEQLALAELCHLEGIPSSAQAYLIACYAESLQLQATSHTTAKSLVVVSQDVRSIDELANELEAWQIKFLYYPEVAGTDAESLRDPDLQAERLGVLSVLSKVHQDSDDEEENTPKEILTIVLTTQDAMEQSVPAVADVKKSRLTLKLGQTHATSDVIKALIDAGYEKETLTAARGQFSQRGGILDVYSWHSDLPVRIEWFGDEIDSIREFDPVAQQSVQMLESCELLLLSNENEDSAAESSQKDSSTLLDHFEKAPQQVFLNAPELTDPQSNKLQSLEANFLEHAYLRGIVADQILAENRKKLLAEHIRDWLEEGWDVWFSCNNEGEAQRLKEWLTSIDIDHRQDAFFFSISPLLRGFIWPEGKLVLLTDAEIFGRYQTLRALRKQDRLASIRSNQKLVDYSELEDGDYVVHVQHGVALYCGMEELPGEDETEQQVLVLEFEGESKLYVPLEQAYLVSKYIGVGKARPKLDILGGSKWEKKRAQAERAIRDYAAKLLKVQAERETLRGHSFPPDTDWQQEFEDSFIYEETQDQLKAIDDTKRDMESPRPMDRLICGDVGFGKTEIAIRAAFKAVASGKQVAFLAPTTVLAQQHWQNLRQRVADYPMTVELLSRFRTRKQQNDVIARTAAGQVDIVVGTHRLISKDMQWKNLGLVIIDEEQRFGVRHKEKFKEIFLNIDVLTLSATPIPRTLYLALMGARDMSVLETAPVNRRPVETTIEPFDERKTRAAIEREIRRGGQVYYLHNRVQTINKIAERIGFLVPGARVDIGHGQMEEGELEHVMDRFIKGETDVLVSTTIIESGIDIPNANTIIIDRADRFGLADLYQLRGRVGRSGTRAYAMLMVPRDMLGGDAGKRVRAIKQYSKLGSGFKIAMRDLEIRGAGNLLGTAQSGHIIAIGFEMYCRLLKTAVAALKGEKAPLQREIPLRIDFVQVGGKPPEDKKTAYAAIPESYMSETRWRISAYKSLAEAQTLDQWKSLRSNWKDRFGRWPDEVENLLALNRIRIQAIQRNYESIETDGGKLIAKRNGDFLMIGGKFPRLTSVKPKNRLLEIEKWITSLIKA